MRLIGTSFDTSDIMIIENPVATVFTQLIKDIGHIPKPDGINVTAKTSTRKVIKNVILSNPAEIIVKRNSFCGETELSGIKEYYGKCVRFA